MGQLTLESKISAVLTWEQMYALVVSSMSLVTSFLYFATGFMFEFRAFALMAAWDLILAILWAAVAGIFGTMYIGEKAEMDNKITQMKAAAGFDIANVILWLITGGYGVYVFFISKGTELMHKGRYNVGKPVTTQ
jgi:hypothetical protein